MFQLVANSVLFAGRAPRDGMEPSWAAREAWEELGISMSGVGAS